MENFSKNKKLNNVLNTIYKELLEICDMEEQSIQTLRLHKVLYKYKVDYNVYEFGNVRIYYDDIRELYKDYKSLQNASNEKLLNIYKRQIRYMTNYIIREYESGK